MLYVFMQIEPACYLVITKCISPKEIKYFEERKKDSSSEIVDDIKQGRLPAGYADRLNEVAIKMLELLSFNRIIERAFKAPPMH